MTARLPTPPIDSMTAFMVDNSSTGESRVAANGFAKLRVSGGR
jgi:hypothetical protein